MTDTRRRGRPPVEPSLPSVRVTVTLSSRQFDQTCHHAASERVTVPEWIRRQLERRQDDDDEED